MAEGEQDGWQLDGGAPELYQRHLVPSMTAMWATDLADRAGLRSGERVLDVACGTGVVARVAAQRVGGTGRVAGLDINPGMLEVARSVPAPDGAPIDWYEGSALDLPFADASLDVTLCQLGLQFFPDRRRALRQIRRVLVPGGRLALSVFGPIEHNPATYALANALDRHAHAGASATKRAEHALADSECLRALVTRAGFGDIVIDTVTKMVQFPSVVDYVQIQLSATPLATLTARVDATGREHLFAAVVDDVGTALGAYDEGGRLKFPQELHILLAHRRL